MKPTLFLVWLAYVMPGPMTGPLYFLAGERKDRSFCHIGSLEPGQP